MRPHRATSHATTPVRRAASPGGGHQRPYRNTCPAVDRTRNTRITPYTDAGAAPWPGCHGSNAYRIWREPNPSHASAPATNQYRRKSWRTHDRHSSQYASRSDFAGAELWACAGRPPPMRALCGAGALWLTMRREAASVQEARDLMPRLHVLELGLLVRVHREEERAPLDLDRRDRAIP